MSLLDIRQLKKSFMTPDRQRHEVIAIPKFELSKEEQIGMRGESGTGKTTLLNMIAGILRPDEGEIWIDQQNMASLSESKRDRLRANQIGYVFQTFNLLHGFTALENVLLGMTFGAGVDQEFAKNLLNRMGLHGKYHHRPRELSSGQQQRVAVARALANRPKLVLADEPTGNLDACNAREALELIRQTCHENNAALLLVSHDSGLLNQFDQVHDLSEINQVAPKSENS